MHLLVMYFQKRLNKYDAIVCCRKAEAHAMMQVKKEEKRKCQTSVKERKEHRERNGKKGRESRGIVLEPG